MRCQDSNPGTLVREFAAKNYNDWHSLDKKGIDKNCPKLQNFY